LLKKDSLAKVTNESAYPPPTDEDVLKVEKLLEREKGHGQYDKHLTCLVVLISQIIISLLRGSSALPSIVGISRCGVLDWLLFSLYIIICGAVTVVAVKRIIAEQALKNRVGKGLIESDLRFNKQTVRSVIITGFAGGFASGCLGLSGGSIFNPLLLSQGVPPSVASSTGMYLILFSSIGSTSLQAFQGNLNYLFALWLGFWSCVASVLGLMALDRIVKRFNRQSPLVIMLTFVLGISTIMVPIFGY
jgi:uncharacterized membrane protein YfcA